VPDPDCNGAGCVTLPCTDDACEYCYGTNGQPTACGSTSSSSSSSSGGTTSSSGGPDGGFHDPDENNGNGTWAQDRQWATPLTLGTAHQGWISFVGDEDFYVFTVTGNGVAHVLLTTPSASAVDYRIQVTCPLRNVFGDAVDTNGSDGPTRLAKDIRLGAANTTARYYLFVHDDGDSEVDTQTPYTVTVTFQP
jgi:hypothetical protein